MAIKDGIKRYKKRFNREYQDTDTTPAPRSCGKLVYKSAAKARKANRLLYANRPDRAEPYQCPFCDNWHLTTHPRKENESSNGTD